jgi:dTMP kinase
MKNKFITFEGGDGSGKTSQLKMLSAWFSARDIPHVITREPGGCPSAEGLRNLLLQGEGDKWDALSESLLFYAARCEHLRTVIRPALESGAWVLCDRFADSTTVFQGAVKGVGRDILGHLHTWVVGNKGPDLTLIFDLPPEEGLARKNQQATLGLTETRMESMGLNFHKKIRDGFLTIAKLEPQRCTVINALGTREEVQNRVLEALKPHLPV